MTQAVDPGVSAGFASAAAGDEVASARIIAAHHDYKRRVCVVICHDETLAEDAVQAAWSIAWRKLASLRELERLRSWLIAIAANQARDLGRKRRRRTDAETQKRHPDQAKTLQLTRRDYLRILQDPTGFKALGVRVYRSPDWHLENAEEVGSAPTCA